MKKYIFEALNENIELLSQNKSVYSKGIIKTVNILFNATKKNNTIFWAGNGGSAADCQHMAAELVGRFEKERPPINSISLTTDTSALTAIGNDYGFDNLFSRQIEALGNKNDVFIGISTSGNSKNIIKALKEINWREKGKSISVRINSLDTHYMYRDLIEIVEEVGEYIDTILLPKAGTSSDVYLVDCLLTQIETNKKIKNRIGIECLIETALGMSNIKEIAQSSPRLEALHFGVADYAASLRARTVVIGGLNPDYPGDQWHHGLSQLVMTCRAYGLRAIDGPFGDFNDPDAYIESAKRAAAIGIEGKWAIHPSQIDLANKVFSPPESEVNKAKRIIEELDKAAKEGKGAAQLDGRMIDAASARMAENVVNIDKLIKNK